MPNNSAPSSLVGLGTMNYPRSYLFIGALCLTHVAPVDATPERVLVSPPLILGTRSAPENGVVPPLAQIIPRRPTPTPPGEFGRLRRNPNILPGPTQPLWLNVTWIVAITGLIGA